MRAEAQCCSSKLISGGKRRDGEFMYPSIAKSASKTRSKALAYAPSSLSFDDMALWIGVVDRQNASRGQCGAQIIHQ